MTVEFSQYACRKKDFSKEKIEFAHQYMEFIKDILGAEGMYYFFKSAGIEFDKGLLEDYVSNRIPLEKVNFSIK